MARKRSKAGPAPDRLPGIPSEQERTVAMFKAVTFGGQGFTPEVDENLNDLIRAAIDGSLPKDPVRRLRVWVATQLARRMRKLEEGGLPREEIMEEFHDLIENGGSLVGVLCLLRRKERAESGEYPEGEE